MPAIKFCVQEDAEEAAEEAVGETQAPVTEEKVIEEIIPTDILNYYALQGQHIWYISIIMAANAIVIS